MDQIKRNTVRSANISTTKVTDSNGKTANTRDITPRSEVTVTMKKVMILAVIGSMCLSTLISVIAGINVYYVTIAKMADIGKQNQDISDVCKELKTNLTAALDEWNEEIKSLKTNVSMLERNLTAASDAWNDSIAHQYSKDCSELYAAGTVVDGVYTISPDGRYPFQVYCDMTGGGWTLIQKRQDGLVSFNRSWQEYAEGFGNIDGDHWLGLDNIHRLTADGSEIYFHFEYYNGTIGFAHYQAFIVHGATTAYRMNVDVFGYNGTIDELFSHHNDVMFATYDRVIDPKTGSNCPKWYTGAWWYNYCYRFGNLNGVYGKQGKGGIVYSTGKKQFFLKNVNMKVKPSTGYY